MFFCFVFRVLLFAFVHRPHTLKLRIGTMLPLEGRKCRACTLMKRKTMGACASLYIKAQ